MTSIRRVDVSLVTGLLTAIRESGASVWLLHTGAGPEESEWSGDIDLLVGSDRDFFLSTMESAAASLGFSVVLKVPRLANTLEIDLLFPGATSWTVVFVDEKGSVLHVDAAFAPGAHPPSAAGPPEFGVPQVGEDVGQGYVVLKRLRKGDDDAEAWAPMAGRPTPALAPFLGEDLAARVADAARRGQPPDTSTLHAARAALLRRRARSPARIAAVARGARVAARRWVRPAGAFVSLGGVDGSGKSAIAEALLEWSPFRHVRWLHSRPEVLKPMGWFVGKKPSDGTNPHGTEPWGPAMSAVRLVYYWADYAVGYWTRIWPVRARGGLVVSERWWWDMYVDPRRHRIQPMPRAARLLGRLVPSADAFVVLDAPSEQIHARKQELSAPEIERQRGAWAELAPAIANLRTVDATPPLPDVTSDVIRAVISQQRRRITPPPKLVAFPRREPRWLVDPGDPESMSDALRLYMPSRRRAVAVARATAAVSRKTRLGSLLVRALGGTPPPAAVDAVESIRAAAAQHAGGQPVRLAAYLGSPGPLQKVSAVVLRENGHELLFAKAASTAPAVEALRNEAEVLGRVGAVVRSAVVPSVIALEETAYGALLLLTPVTGTRVDNRAPAGDDHLKVVAELLTDRRPFDGAAYRDELEAAVAAAEDTPHVAILRAGLRATSAAWPAVRSAHFAHGDFTPWNCLDCQGSLGIVDWEMAGYRLPGYDVLHYLVQIEAITRTGAIGPAVERILAAPFLADAERVVTGAAEVDVPMAERWQTLQLLALIDGGVQLLRTQPELSQRGIAVRTHAIARLLGIAAPDPEQ